MSHGVSLSPMELVDWLVNPSDQFCSFFFFSNFMG